MLFMSNWKYKGNDTSYGVTYDYVDKMDTIGPHISSLMIESPLCTLLSYGTIQYIKIISLIFLTYMYLTYLNSHLGSILWFFICIDSQLGLGFWTF